MKQTKMFMDSRPQEQPEGTYPFAKNGIQNDLNGSSFNEPGFRAMAAVIPYKFNGIIETDSKPIIFSTDNTNSAIGYFNPETELYEAIIDDRPANLVNWDVDWGTLNFNLDYYITGQSQRNYKGEMVVAFTDKLTFPKYLNCDTPSLSSLDDLRMFPYFLPPTITAVQNLGGRLSPGAYYVAVGYERNDGTSSPYSAVSSSVLITPSAIAGTTDKSIAITIENADTNYDSVRIAIISRIDGKTTAVELADFYPVSGSTLNLVYTGDNLSRDISIEEILTPPALYARVGTIGQLNDALYIGDLEIEPDLNDMQPYASNIKLEWISELVDATAPPQEHVTGEKKSFMHQEVYAFYVRYKKTRGGFTKWFTIPGNVPTANNLLDSTEASTGGMNGVPKFKVEDTIPYFNPVTFTGGTGVYQNETEEYPNTTDFGTLAGQPVLHHKMPSLRWCKQNLYNSNDTYGKTHLDILGIKATGVRIPDKYIGIINGYEIGYAIRNVGNMTVYGQGTLLHGAQNTAGDSLIYSSGGNFRTEIFHKGDNSFDNKYELSTLKLNSFRFHAFDILFNKPSISPTFISAQLKLRRDNLRSEGYLEDGAITEGQDAPTVHLIDYTKGTVQQVGSGNLLREITSSSYLSNNVNFNGFVNARHEDVFAGLLDGPDWPINYGSAGFRVKGQSYTEPEVGSPGFEETYLTNLIAIKSDVYSNFYSQLLTSAGSAKVLIDTTPFWGGDSFVSAYTFHTYGRHETNDGWGEGYKGKKIIRRFVCESVANINLRYEIPGNEYSKWYPHNPAIANAPQQCYITYFDRSKDPNQFGYSKDFNALNNLISSVTFSPFREELTVFPYRVHRGGKNTRQGLPRSWRTFLPLDYYECQKNMGRIINILGMDDRLLIHHENALFRTQDKAKLDGGVLSITLGTGDIFQFEPQEPVSAKLGYAGTQHDLACVQTPVGYVFPDMKQGEIYLYKGEVKNLNDGVNTFLRDYMRITGKNVFTGNGATIGWDQKYKRILISVKNQKVSDPSIAIKTFEDTADFWNNLTIGDIIWYKNRYIEYVGVNNTIYTCPADVIEDVITWQKTGAVCLQISGANTGIKGWATRARLTNGTLDGYTEANQIAAGLGPYFPPETDLTTCPLPTAVTTWRGANGYCEQSLGSCPPGYTLSADGTLCLRQETTAPTIITSAICVVRSQLVTQYSSAGTKLYATGYSTQLVGTSTLLNSYYWIEHTGLATGPMNRVSVWTDSDCDGDVDALTSGVVLEFTKQIITTAAKTVYIGFGGDNSFRLDLNGTIITECTFAAPAGGGGASDNFNYWHVIPVTLVAGSNLLSFKSVGDGSTSDAFGVVIYDNTAAELTAATTDADLTILFRTSDIIGTPIDIATCTSGWILDTTGGSGNYICRRTTTSTPIPSGVGNTGTYIYRDRQRLINGVPDGFSEANTAGANYVASIVNSSECAKPVIGLICGSFVNETYKGTGVYTYPEKVISITSGTVNITYQTYLRPNRFTIYKNGGLLFSSGWVGEANYMGPWGSTLLTPATGTLTYTVEPGQAYSIKIEAAATNIGVNEVTDSYELTVNCTP